MDIEVIRQLLSTAADGLPIRMVDGTVHEIPHRDGIALGPPPDPRTAPRKPSETPFVVHTHPGQDMRLVNALLVAEAQKRGAQGPSSVGGRRKSA